MNDDPYLIPGSGVLRNKLGIQDAPTLDRLERRLSTERASQGVPAGDFDLKHLRAIHGHLFQDVYDWAGQVRSVEITKGESQFQFRQFIDTGMADVHRRIVASNYLRGLDQDAFAGKAGEILGDVNYVHPFREGNGRTQMAYLEQLATQAGHKIDLSLIDGERWIEASKQAHRGDYAGMSDVIASAMDPRRALDRKLADVADRTDGRDLVQLTKIVRDHGERLSDAQIGRLDRATADLDKLAERYAQRQGRGAASSPSDGSTDRIIALREAVEDELGRRDRGRVHDRPTFHVVVGAIGAGKSALVADRLSDVPEDRGTGRVSARGDASGNGLVLESRTLDEAVLERMQDARSEGYRVELNYVRAASAEQAAQRSARRIVGSGPVVENARSEMTRAEAAIPDAAAYADQIRLYDNGRQGRPMRVAADLERESYRFDPEAPAWSKDIAERVAQAEHGRATTRADMDRALERAKDVARADGLDVDGRQPRQEDRGAGRSQTVRERNDDGHGL